MSPHRWGTDVDLRRADAIHLGSERGYGTRSSTLLWLGEPGTRSEWRFAEGAPCETEYEDRSELLRELGLGQS